MTTFEENTVGQKRALSIGINYPGTSHSLRGCVNDSIMIEQLLREHYGFEDIQLLLDNEATTANIRVALNALVKDAKPGDTLFFHYSGHGSQMLNNAGSDYEPDGLDEIICPVDLDWDTKVIRDDELKAIFDRVPNGVNLTIFLDCCNSGSGLDQVNEYQSLAPGERSVVVVDASSRYLPPPASVLKIAAQQGLHTSPRLVSRKVDHSALMISGCQSHQTSADAKIGGVYRGAATYYLNNTLNALAFNATYVDVVDKLNKDIAAAGFTQRPQLDGPVKLHNKAFLSQYVVDEMGSASVESSTQPQKPDDKKDIVKKYILPALVVVAIVYVVTYFLG